MGEERKRTKEDEEQEEKVQLKIEHRWWPTKKQGGEKYQPKDTFLQL